MKRTPFILLAATLSFGFVHMGFSDPIKVLMLGGNKHHNYKKVYGEMDRATIEKDGLAKVTYTENIVAATAAMKDTDILMACGNVPYDDDFKKAFVAHLDQGKSVILLHAATWTRGGWKVLNNEIMGGAPRGHEKAGLTFDVKNLKADHPLMKGLSASFEIADELYRMNNTNPKLKWEVLSQSHSRTSGESYPSIFLVAREKGTILCCTLGHDEKSRVPDYNKFLLNAIRYLGKK